MREALTTNCQQSKPLTSWWWLKHCRNVCHVSRPENWHSKSFYLRSWRYCTFADWFWKKPDFPIVLRGRARFEPKYVHFSGCPTNQHRGRSDQCKMGLTDLQDSYGSWHLYICRFLFGLSTFYVASLLFMKSTSCCVAKEKLEPFKRGHRSAWFPLLSACKFVEFDPSINCHVLVYCFGSFLLHDMFLRFQVFAFEGQNMTFTVNVLLSSILYCDAGSAAIRTVCKRDKYSR